MEEGESFGNKTIAAFADLDGTVPCPDGQQDCKSSCLYRDTNWSTPWRQPVMMLILSFFSLAFSRMEFAGLGAGVGNSRVEQGTTACFTSIFFKKYEASSYHEQ